MGRGEMAMVKYVWAFVKNQTVSIDKENTTAHTRSGTIGKSKNKINIALDIFSW